MFSLRPRLGFFIPIFALLSASPSSAQTAGSPSDGPSMRAQLTERLRVADSAGRTDEAFMLRTRLRDGDFEVGDRIDVRFEGPGLPTAPDSLIVRAGKVVTLPYPMGDLNLTGLLRAEAVDSVTARLAKYFRTATVHLSPRLRISVTGAVRSPGLFYARSDMPLSEVVLRAGGQDPSTDLSNIVIKRAAQIVWQKEDVQSAMVDGLTIERLGLEPGDEIVVGTRNPSNRNVWLQAGLLILTIAIPVLLRAR